MTEPGRAEPPGGRLRTEAEGRSPHTGLLSKLALGWCLGNSNAQRFAPDEKCSLNEKYASLCLDRAKLVVQAEPDSPSCSRDWQDVPDRGCLQGQPPDKIPGRGVYGDPPVDDTAHTVSQLRATRVSPLGEDSRKLRTRFPLEPSARSLSSGLCSVSYYSNKL